MKYKGLFVYLNCYKYSYTNIEHRVISYIISLDIYNTRQGTQDTLGSFWKRANGHLINL